MNHMSLSVQHAGLHVHIIKDETQSNRCRTLPWQPKHRIHRLPVSRLPGCEI